MNDIPKDDTAAEKMSVSPVEEPVTPKYQKALTDGGHTHPPRRRSRGASRQCQLSGCVPAPSLFTIIRAYIRSAPERKREREWRKRIKSMKKKQKALPSAKKKDPS